MASTGQSFGTFRENLEITGLQAQTVSARQQGIREHLAEEFAVKKDYLTGSYPRGTQIGPLVQADIDIVTVLPRSLRASGPRSVLDLIKRRLAKKYRNSKISRNGQAVTITFVDFVVDVVPAFDNFWDGRIDICDSGSDQWIRTDPRRHGEISARINRRTGGLLVPTVKMLKAWNRTAGAGLHGFHLEAQAWDVFNPGVWFPHRMGEDWINVRHFFDQARTRLRHQLRDPAGTGKDIGAYLRGAALDEAVSKAQTALNRCLKAEEMLAAGRHEDANAVYRKVFGAQFPAR